MRRIRNIVRCPRTLAITILCTLVVAASAQQAAPVARLDSSTIRIGEQTVLDLSIGYRTDQGPVSIVWPVISDTITGHVEVVRVEAIDTVKPGPNDDPHLLLQRRSVVITSFDSGFWAVPPFRFTVNGDTMETAPLLLTVHTVEVDTAQAFRDIKDIYELPFSWTWWLREHWPWIAGGAAILASLVFLVIWMRRKPRGVLAAVKEPEKGLDIRTLEALEAVGVKKLWQQGFVKQHYIEVTDILRGYVEARFRVPALERTTDDLVKELSLSSMAAGQREQLANLLRLADMVKFAKWNPSPTENEQLLLGAMQLVRDTSSAPQPTTDAPRS